MQIPVNILEMVEASMESSNPLNLINEAEMDNAILKLGTFLSLVYNKNVNPTFMFLKVVGDPNIQKLTKELTGIGNIVTILKILLYRYPNLIKSKMLKRNAIKYVKKLKVKR